MGSKLEEYIEDYLMKLKEELESIDYAKVKEVVNLLIEAKRLEKRVFLIGNGGSSSIATHFAADLLKTSGKDIRALSLSENVPLFTAILNDMGFSNTFSYQIERLLERGDILFVFSVHGGSSTTSSNLVKAAIKAKEKGGKVVSFVGFDGGRLKEISDICIHIKSYHTGRVESIFSVLTHMVTFFLKEGEK